MSNLQLLPLEVRELASGVSETKKQEVETVLSQIFTGTSDWESQVDAIEVKDINDKMSIQLADVARKNAKQARISAEKIFDAKRDEVQKLKQEFDIEDKLWLKAKQIMQIKFKAIEEKAEWKASFVKRYEAEQKELRTQNRILKVAQYAELNRIEFEEMSDETFEKFLSGLKNDYDSRIEAERKAEEERIAKEKADAEERERIRIENEKLKAEAEAKEKQLQEERKKAESERVALEEKARKEKQEQERILAEERAKKELELKREREAKELLELELEAKRKAQERIERERKAEEEKARKEAEKLAKAPIKKQLNIWIDSFSLGKPVSENQTTQLIEEKFESFRNWAKQQVELL